MPSGQIENPVILRAVVKFMARCTQPAMGIWIKNGSLRRAYCWWTRWQPDSWPWIPAVTFGKVLTQLGYRLTHRRFNGTRYTARGSIRPTDELKDFLILDVDYR